MTTVLALWLPILLSGVAVYIVSSIIHMATPWHKGDYLKLPDEDGVLDALRPFALPPGDYSAPRAGSMQEMGTPEFVEKMKRGPVIMATVMPSAPMAIGRSLAQWFVYSLVVAWFAAYTAGVAIPPGATAGPSAGQQCSSRITGPPTLPATRSTDSNRLDSVIPSSLLAYYCTDHATATSKAGATS